jgi:hypothetical protein
MRSAALIFALPVVALTSCVSFESTETRARAAERTDPGFAVPFDRPSGMPPQGVSSTLTRPPAMVELPHADPDRVQLDLDERIAQDERLAEDVAELDVDWRDGSIVLDGVVTSQRAHDRLEEIARRVAPGSPVRNALVVRIQ